MATLYEVRAKANSALAAGDHRTALSLALLMRRRFPDDYQTVQLLGKIYLETHRIPDALEALHRVLEVDPEDVVTWSALGIIAEEEGDLDGALEYFERAFDIDPGNHEVAGEMARLNSQLNHTRPSEPGSSVHSLARRFLIEGKYESAVPWLQEALRITPESAEVATGLARALWQSWRLKEAAEVALMVLARHPDCLRALVVAAGAAYSRGGEGILPILDRTAALNPGNVVARSFFAEAGILFPDRPEDLEIPEAEIEGALAAAAGDGELTEETLTVGLTEVVDVSTAAYVAAMEAAAESQAEEASRDLPAEEQSQSAEPEPPEEGEPEPPEEEPNPLLRRLAASLNEAPPEEAESAWLDAREEAREEPSVVEIDSEAVSETQESSGPGPEDAGSNEANEAPEEGPPLPSADDYIAAGASFARQGLLDLALDEYRKAVKRDPAVALEVSEAALALAEANPSSLKARWLAGDALAVDGKFRKAVEQYLQVLRGGGAESAPDPSTFNWQD